jgi:hypothetical protein
MINYSDHLQITNYPRLNLAINCKIKSPKMHEVNVYFIRRNLKTDSVSSFVTRTGYLIFR